MRSAQTDSPKSMLGEPLLRDSGRAAVGVMQSAEGRRGDNVATRLAKIQTPDLAMHNAHAISRDTRIFRRKSLLFRVLRQLLRAPAIKP